MLDEDTYEQIVAVALCERFHWTLDYVRSLGLEDFEMVRNIVNGFDEGRNVKE